MQPPVTHVTLPAWQACSSPRQRHRHQLRFEIASRQDRSNLDDVAEIAAVLDLIAHHANPRQVHSCAGAGAGPLEDLWDTPLVAESHHMRTGHTGTGLPVHCPFTGLVELGVHGEAKRRGPVGGNGLTGQ